VAVAAVGPVVARFFADRSRARRRASGSARSPGRSFHIDGSSSKWLSAGELACQPQATSALAVSRIQRHDDRSTRGGAIFATRSSKEKPMRICIFGVGAIGGYIAGIAGVPGLDVGVVARGPHLAAIRDRGLRVMTLERDRARYNSLCCNPVAVRTGATLGVIASGA
jgi:hypothetical protein